MWLRGFFKKRMEGGFLNIPEMLLRLDERLARIEERLTKPLPTQGFKREWFTVSEAAELLSKRPFTIREWCRLNRIQAKKRKCGRGRTTEWVIALDEIQRYLNEGLLPVES